MDQRLPGMNLLAEVRETLEICKHFHKFSLSAWILERKKWNNVALRIIVNPIGQFESLKVDTRRQQAPKNASGHPPGLSEVFKLAACPGFIRSIWNSCFMLIYILWKSSAQPHPVISARGHKSTSWNHYLWNKKLITWLSWSTCWNPAGGGSCTKNMSASPPRGEQNKAKREASQVLPELLSGLQVKEVNSSRSQWKK